jgi:hypothetical protein
VRRPGGDDQLLALWLPGDHPVALEPGAGFQVTAGEALTVRVNYRKTWEYERRQMTDRSEIGLYAAGEPAAMVRSLPIAASGRTIDEPVHALAIAPDPWLSDVDVTVTAIRPNGTRDTLIAFRPRRGWARRYWFREPVLLPRGTRLAVHAALVDDRLLPPAALRPSDRGNPQPVRLTLDVVSAP